MATEGRDARSALLAAALAAFAEHGIAASSTGAIARRAGVTPAMVQYYFGSREALIEAVAEECIAPVLREVLAPIDLQLAPREALAAVVERIFEGVELSPWLPPLWIREIATEGGHLRSPMLKRLPRARIAEFAQRFRTETHADNGPEPALVFLSVVGLTLFPLATRSLWRHLLGAEDIGPERLRRHAIAVLTHGLLPPTCCQEALSP